MSINLIMPMGGAGTRFADLGYESPKPLIKIGERCFFEYAADSILKGCKVESLVFVVLKEHVERFSIDKKIKRFAPYADIVVLEQVLNGAVLTCMEGAKAIANELPLVFCDCDLMFRSEKLYDYIEGRTEKLVYGKNELDGFLLTFENSDERFSYVEIDENGHVIKTAEKKAISDRAVCGAYGFRDRDTFLKYAKEYLENCPYKEFFMSGVYNVMIEDGKIIGEFPTDSFLSFGTPAEYEEAKKILENPEVGNADTDK